MSHLTLPTTLMITSPSGGGKGTAVKYILSAHPSQFTLSVSCTTRAKAASETEGKEYYFLSQAEFDQKVKEDAFLEYNEVYPGKCYGTLKSEVDRAEREGKILILEIDVDGAVNVKKILGDKALFTFIDAGDDIAAYEARIHARARDNDTPDSIQKRKDRIAYELTRGRAEADVIIPNTGSLDDYNQAVESFLANNFSSQQ